MISEVSDLQRIHCLKPLKHRQALSCTQTVNDPVQSAPWTAVTLKYMYRNLTLNTCLESKDGIGSKDYEAILIDHFVEQHLLYAGEAVLATKRRLTKNRSWRLPPAINYRTEAGQQQLYI